MNILCLCNKKGKTLNVIYEEKVGDWFKIKSYWHNITSLDGRHFFDNMEIIK